MAIDLDLPQGAKGLKLPDWFVALAEPLGLFPVHSLEHLLGLADSRAGRCNALDMAMGAWQQHAGEFTSVPGWLVAEARAVLGAGTPELADLAANFEPVRLLVMRRALALSAVGRAAERMINDRATRRVRRHLGKILEKSLEKAVREWHALEAQRDLGRVGFAPPGLVTEHGGELHPTARPPVGLHGSVAPTPR